METGKESSVLSLSKSLIVVAESKPVAKSKSRRPIVCSFGRLSKETTSRAISSLTTFESEVAFCRAAVSLCTG